PQRMPALLRALNGSLLNLFRRDANHVICSLRRRNDLLQVNKELILVDERDYPKALSTDTATEQPKHRRRHLAAEVRGDEDHTLPVPRVEHRLFQLFDFHEFADSGDGAATTAVAIKVVLVDLNDLSL